MLVILARLEAQQRQPEPILAAHFAMTPAGIAAELGENRHDLIGEIDGRIVGEMRDGHGDRSLLAARRLGRDRRLSVGRGPNQADIINSHDPGRFGRVMDLPGQIAKLATTGATAGAMLVPLPASVPVTINCWRESRPARVKLPASLPPVSMDRLLILESWGRRGFGCGRCRRWGSGLLIGGLLSSGFLIDRFLVRGL